MPKRTFGEDITTRARGLYGGIASDAQNYLQPIVSQTVESQKNDNQQSGTGLNKSYDFVSNFNTQAAMNNPQISVGAPPPTHNDLSSQ